MLDGFSAIDATLQQGAAHCRIEAGQTRPFIAIADRAGAGLINDTVVN
jgi:hypothetical protein